MKWSRVKTILIYFLLAANLCIGCYLFLLYAREQRILSEAVRNSIYILEKNNIFVNPESIPIDTSLRDFTVVRRSASEEALASSIIGSISDYQSLGGGMVKYLSDSNDEVLFRGGGYFEAILQADENPPDDEVAVRERLYRLFSGSSISVPKDSIHVQKTENGYSVHIDMLSGGTDIYNSYIDAEFSDSKIYITGRILLGDAYLSETTPKSAPELLVTLSQKLKKENSKIINIDSIELGRLITGGQGTNIAVKAVWKINFSDEVIYLSLTDGEFK